MRLAIVTALLAVLVAAGAGSARAGSPAPWPKRPEGSGWAQLIRELMGPKIDKHERRANRYVEACLADSSPAGFERHDYDVAQGELVAWWGAAEYQTGTVQIWWAHWPAKDHNPTLAGVMFSAYGIPVGGPLYNEVDRCTTAAVNRDIWRG